MPVICPGAHNNGWRRDTAAGRTPARPAAYGEPVHCLPCQSRTWRELRELPELVAAIHIEALRGTPGPPDGAAAGPTPAEAPAWPGQSARLLTDLIVGGLSDIANDTRQLLGEPEHARGPEGAMLTDSIAYLTAKLRWLLAEHPLADEAHEGMSGNPAWQIHRWHAAAERFTARDPRYDQKDLPCPHCGKRTLFRADEPRGHRRAGYSDYTECKDPACGYLLTVAEYEWHVQEQTRAARAAA